MTGVNKMSFTTNMKEEITRKDINQIESLN